ncbi:MAG: hypothetical protein KZQ93_19600 [Candidatus Thiodiazotropha sp. (ex Monitilora ramsayi)]|nr:hypothetical protein [Candidatus Thiodiazotropha sp. (ex Monitilora ramsayi)]
MRSANISDSLINASNLESFDELDHIEKDLASDRRAILLVVLLSFFFGLTIGVLTTSVFADEGVTSQTQSSLEAADKKDSKPAWKPPVAKQATAPKPIDAELTKKIMQEKGVEILSLQLTAAGYMMDFRFRVLDVKKAKDFFDYRIKPYLHVEKSNAKLPVPMAAKVGAFRSTDRGKNIKPNKTYYIVFGNPDAHVKRGEKVTLVMGDFKVEGMTVN